MSELGEKVKRAVDLFKRYEPTEGYWLGFSGGKDGSDGFGRSYCVDADA